MKVLRIFIVCASVLILAPSTYMQQCFKRCNCLQKSFQVNKCTENIQYLSIYLHTKAITIYCRKSISTTTDGIQTFDASYLSIIDDESSLTLEAMLRKCYKTKEKHIRYAIDLNKLYNISATNIISDDKNTIKHLKIEGESKFQKHLNISILGPQFGSGLETLIVNNFPVPDIKNYFENIPKIETLDLASNGIDDFSEVTFRNLNALKKISLRDNRIRYLNPAIFNGAINIISLDLSKNRISSLENTTFSNLDELRYLNLSKNKLRTIKAHTFDSNSLLEHLDLSDNINLSLPENIFENLLSLISLNLSGCYITHIQENLLQKCRHLQVLNMSRNEIPKLENNTFSKLSVLTVLDLSYNQIETLSTALLRPLKKLQHLYLGSNKLTVFSSEVFWSIDTLETIDVNSNLISSFHNSLGKFSAFSINLNSNKLTKFPVFLVYIVTTLKHLDLSNNRILYVELVKDLVPKTCNMEIDLSDNVIKDINVTHLENSQNITNAKKNWKMTFNLANNYLECNCKQFKLYQVPQKQANAMLEITNQENFCLDETKKQQCPLVHIKHCPKLCSCYFRKADSAIIVDCSFRNLTKFPKITNLESMHYLYRHNQTKVILKGNELNSDGQDRLQSYDNVTNLDLSSNKISRLQWIPKRALELNLENNRLSTLSQGVVEALSKNRDFKRLTVRGNPWICDCKAIYLQKYLIRYNNIKVNQSAVICQSTSEPLVYSKICEKPTSVLKVAIPVGLTALLAIISALLALYFRYSTSIKIYLYSRNLCLWFVEEEELDKEKKYDIFISYSYKDEYFVTNDLLPELEKGDTSFNVCIHYRNWLPGEFISQQIISSVRDSRRTLVILSNNFMESVWGKMEFRTAHMQAISEGRARIIVVIYGELNEDTLDDEMKAYLKTNTYVKWGDPWFWSKLKYALPHAKNRSRNLTNHSLESFVQK